MKPSSVISTLPNGKLSEEIEQLISNATEGDEIRIISPVIDDERIVQLIAAARRHGVVVHVLTTLLDRHGIRTRGWDGSQNINAHHEAIRRLAMCGVLLRSPLTTPHGKLVHVSIKSAIFGSMNLAKSSLRGVSLEAALLINCSDALSKLATAFDTIWNKSCFRMHNRNGEIRVEEINPQNNARYVPLENTANDGIQVLISKSGSPATGNRLAELVSKAKQRIILVAMSLYETDKIPNFGEQLLLALKRGVRIDAVVRLNHFRAQEQRGEYPDDGTKDLIREGMMLHGINGLHAKGFLIDDTWCGIQSANFNPYSLDNTLAKECNVELFMIGQTTQKPLREYAEFLNSLVKKATHLMTLE